MPILNEKYNLRSTDYNKSTDQYNTKLIMDISFLHKYYFCPRCTFN